MYLLITFILYTFLHISPVYALGSRIYAVRYEPYAVIAIVEQHLTLNATVV
jgi:hypothetical protein